jgi:hypothetical protein
MAYTQTSRPGSRAPHVWLAKGRSTLDLFGRGFVLLRLDAGGETPAIEAAARDRRVPLEVVTLDSAAAREAYAKPLVLVRPDGFVAWSGEALPADAGALIDRVGATSPP